MQGNDQFAAAAAHLDSLISAKDAADFLGITPRTLRRYIAAGKIHALRTSPTGSGRVRVLRSELVRALRVMAGGEG